MEKENQIIQKLQKLKSTYKVASEEYNTLDFAINLIENYPYLEQALKEWRQIALKYEDNIWDLKKLFIKLGGKWILKEKNATTSL